MTPAVASISGHARQHDTEPVSESSAPHDCVGVAERKDRIDAATDCLLFLHNSLSDRTDGLSERETRGLARHLSGIVKLLAGTAMAIVTAPIVVSMMRSTSRAIEYLS